MTHPIGVGNSLSTRPVYNSKWMQVLYQYHSAALACDVVTGSFEVQKTFGIRRLRARWDFCVQLCRKTALPGNETVVGVNFNSTPEGRLARRTGCFGYTRVGSISPMQDLTVRPPSCVISENSRSLAAIFFSAGNTRHCSRVYISRDLIWIKIVVGKTIYKQIVIILAIRFAVLSTVFQWK